MLIPSYTLCISWKKVKRKLKRIIQECIQSFVDAKIQVGVIWPLPDGMTFFLVNFYFFCIIIHYIQDLYKCSVVPKFFIHLFIPGFFCEKQFEGKILPALNPTKKTFQHPHAIGRMRKLHFNVTHRIYFFSKSIQTCSFLLRKHPNMFFFIAKQNIEKLERLSCWIEICGDGQRGPFYFNSHTFSKIENREGQKRIKTRTAHFTQGKTEN